MIFGYSESELASICATHTAKETMQQPQSWRNTYAVILQMKDKIKNFLDTNLSKNTRVVLTGAGSSAYIGDTICKHIKNITGARVESIATTDIVINPSDILEETKTILVSFGRSGNSPESVGAYNVFNDNLNDIVNIVVTCNAEGELAKEASKNSNNLVILLPEETNDKGFAMTSSFTCMILAALLLFDIESLEKNKEIVETIALQGEEILQNQWTIVKELSDLNPKRIVYLGSKYFAQLAQEMRLKNLELTNGKIPTLFESILGFRHGPKTFINDETLIIVMDTVDEYVKPYTYDILNELHNDVGTHRVVALGYYNDPKILDMCDKYITINGKEIPEIYIALNYILYAQMLGLFNSIAIGNTPDNPNPTGAVNRVVKGVTIYPYKK